MNKKVRWKKRSEKNKIGILAQNIRKGKKLEEKKRLENERKKGSIKES